MEILLTILNGLLVMLGLAEAFYLVLILFISVMSYEYTGNFKLFISDLLIPYRRFYREHKEKNKNITK